MKPDQLVKKIRFFALISFLIPLICINTCFYLYKLMGSIDLYADFNWSEENIEFDFSEYQTKTKDFKSQKSGSFTNCPKNIATFVYITDDISVEDKSENVDLMIKLGVYDLEKANNKIAIVKI